MRCAAREAGFGYIGIILTVAAFGIGLAAIGELWSTHAQREREAELLRIGDEFRRALIGYHANTKPGMPMYPARLEELLEDRRGSVLRRHLRRIYVDPITGTTDWGLVTGPDGRIRGVFSPSERAPLKSARFDPADANFSRAKTYADWRFEYVPRNAPSAPRAR